MVYTSRLQLTRAATLSKFLCPRCVEVTNFTCIGGDGLDSESISDNTKSCDRCGYVIDGGVMMNGEVIIDSSDNHISVQKVHYDDIYCAVLDTNDYNKHFPEHFRRAAVAMGKVYIALSLFGDERELIKKISSDLEGFFFDEGHVFIPIRWAINNFPSMEEVLLLMESGVLKAFRKNLN